MLNLGNAFVRTSKANSESEQSAVESSSDEVPHKDEVETVNKFYDSLKTYIDKLTKLKENMNKFNIDKNGKIIHGTKSSVMSGNFTSTSKTYRNEEIKNKIEKYQGKLNEVETEKNEFDQKYTEFKKIKIELTSDEKLTDLVDPKDMKAVNDAVEAKLQEQLSDTDTLIEKIKALDGDAKQKVLAALQEDDSDASAANGDGGGSKEASLGGGLRTRTTRRTNRTPKRRRTRTRSYPRTRRR